MREWEPGARHEINMHRRERAQCIREAWMKGKTCVKCGEDDPYILRLVHRVRTGQPELSIASLVSAGRIKRLREELPKCDVLCRRCVKGVSSARDRKRQEQVNVDLARWDGQKHGST